MVDEVLKLRQSYLKTTNNCNRVSFYRRCLVNQNNPRIFVAK